jgi:uncharacterized protein (UPF0248 family)
VHGAACITNPSGLNHEMIPIHELLNRIKWDDEFGRAEFTIGYHDRFEKDTIKVALKELLFNKEGHFDFELIDDMGETHTVPLHRIRDVYRNGKLIWHREGGE